MPPVSPAHFACRLLVISLLAVTDEGVAVTSFMPSISRDDAEEFMLRQLTDETYVRGRPRLMS